MNYDYIHTKTAIIGAGVSGISASVHLLKNDYKEFLIFEAMDRTGGRCHTMNYEKSFLEFGAQFIHGQVNNPIFYIARENGQIEEKYNKIQLDEDCDNNGINIEISDEARCASQYLFTTQHGDTVDLKLANEIYQISNKAVRMAESYSELNLSTAIKDTSVADYMLLKYTELIQERFADELRSDTGGQLKGLIDGMFVWRCKCENVENGCDNMFKVSLNNFNTFEELKGSQIIQTKHGYKAILDLIIQDFKDEFNARLHLNHSLSRILICKHLKRRSKSNKNESKNCEHCKYTSQQSKIVVLLTDLTRSQAPQNRIVICDNIVCTMSLGFLKNNLSKLIEPVELVPVEKLLAVSRLGFGAINKIFLVYDKPFWNEDLVGIYPIHLLESSESVFKKLGELSASSWFESICYFETGKDNKKVLCAWMSGCGFCEDFSDEVIAQDCTEYLRRLLKRNDIPEPISVLRSFWSSNPYFNGSYSYLPLGSYPIDFKNIGNPICVKNRPVVMFAGEATIKKYYSTVHGAYISGEREAQRILNFLRFT